MAVSRNAFRRLLLIGGTLLAVIAAFALGFAVRALFTPDAADGGASGQPVAETAAAETVIYTCSMHPQIRREEPGQCPICGMDLIPVESGGSSTEGARELVLGEHARQLAQIQVTPVVRDIVSKTVAMVGKVEYDETRVETITAWVPGRLDRLFVDYTGVPVKQGDHMVTMYSPEILTAQQELLQAIRTVGELEGSNVSIVRETAKATVESARDKLRLLGLTKEQIEQIEARGTPSDQITIYAPQGGIVIHKNAVEGMYVNTGTKIYTIADLSHLWVMLNAYESDLAWIRYAQDVAFTTEAYPGETFHGRISFIEPFLNENTRTIRVRVNVPNEHGRLKPGMFVRARVQSRLAGDNRVVDPDVAGKWISPMHPEIIKDEPGECDVCGMPLVKAETLGFITVDDVPAEAPLVIPASAPLITGRRAVVYVQDPDEPARFQGRVIDLGQRAGDRFIVNSGLQEGELVVTQGAFKVDSALQILAEPSMMSPAQEDGAKHDHGEMQGAGEDADAQPSPEPVAVPAEFTEQFGNVVDAYLATQKGLSQDSFADAMKAAEATTEALRAVDMSLLSGDPHMAWMDAAGELGKTLDAVRGAGDLEGARRGFALLSEAMSTAMRRFGQDLPDRMVQMRCPMAFDNRGAIWVQDHPDVENPYFGEAMFRCGEVTDVLTPGTTEPKEEGEANE